MSLYNIEDEEFVLLTDKMFQEGEWQGLVTITWDLTKHPILIVRTVFRGVSLRCNSHGHPRDLFAVSVTHDAAITRSAAKSVFYRKYDTAGEALRAHKTLVRILSNPQRRLFDITLLCVD